MQRYLSVAVALAAWAALAGPARAQEPLTRAEDAYQAVDFEATRDAALEALRSGQLDPAQLTRTYELLGVSSAALGELDAARDYFLRLLWLDPSAQLDDSVSPRMREPYLEARGARTARSGSLSVEAGIDRATSRVHVTLRDPSAMARRVRVAARLEGGTDYTVQEYEARAELAAPLSGADTADRIEYYVEVLDLHGNVLLAQGGPFAPRVVGREPTSASSGSSEGGDGGGSIVEDPLFWVVLIGAAALVGGGVGLGVGLDQQSRISVQSEVAFGF